MPHKGPPRTSTESVAPNERAAGADLLLSLAETATEHAKSVTTTETSPSIKNASQGQAAANAGQKPIQTENPATEATAATATTSNHQASQQPSHSSHPPVTPSPLVQGSGAKTSSTMQMSVHGNTGAHRMLVPSPIKLPKIEQRKRAADDPENDECGAEDNEKEAGNSETNKKPRHDTSGQSLKQSSPQPPSTNTAENSSPTQDPYSNGTNTLISPASSNEGQKSPTSGEATAPSATTTTEPSAAETGQPMHPPHAPTPHYHPPGPPTHVGTHYPPQYHHPATPSNQPWLHPVSYYHHHHPMAPAGYATIPPPPHHHAHHQYYAVAVPPPYGAPPPPGVAAHPPPAASNSTGTAKGKERETLKAEEVQKNIEEWQKTRATIGNKARCVPVDNPSKARQLVPNPEAIDTKLPDFPLLVNFPEHLTRGQTRGTGESKGLAPEGKRHCVMCGLLRICSSSANRLNRSTAPAQADSTVHIIPRQNKGVCTACDVTVWTVKDVPNLDIKWCKGCKNFRPWPAFGDKGMATKCARCRNRQREKYALQKKQGQYDFKKEDDILAAQGLSNLMRAQNA